MTTHRLTPVQSPAPAALTLPFFVGMNVARNVLGSRLRPASEWLPVHQTRADAGLGRYWEISQAIGDDWAQYQRSVEGSTLVLVLPDDTSDRILAADEHIEFDEALARQEAAEAPVYGAFIRGARSWMSSMASAVGLLHDHLTTPLDATQRAAVGTHLDFAATQLNNITGALAPGLDSAGHEVEFHMLRWTFARAYLEGLGAGLHNTHEQRYRALAVADHVAGLYWSKSTTPDAGNQVAIPVVTFIDPRSRTADDFGRSLRSLRKVVTDRAVAVVRAYAGTAVVAAHWEQWAPPAWENTDDPTSNSKLTTAGKTAITALVNASDESRLAAADPSAVSTFTASVDSKDAATADLDWTFGALDDNGTVITGWEIEINTDGAGFGSTHTVFTPSYRTYSWASLAVGSHIFRIRPKGTRASATVYGPWLESAAFVVAAPPAE